MIKAKLIVVGGDAKRTEVQLKRLPATIGRAREASITLPHSLVSRQHCEIFERDNQLLVRDLNSLNGTYLNNEKITQPVNLLSGQLLTLGNVTFRAVYATDETGQDVLERVESEHDNGPTLGHEQDDTIDVNMLEVPPVTLGSVSQHANPAEIDTDHGKPASPHKARSNASVADADIGRNKQEPNDTDAHKFVFDDDLNDAAKPVSLGAIAELPDQAPPASFAGKIQVEDGPESPLVDPDSIKIDLGVESAAPHDPSQSSLDAFLRKMPK